jgi:hypothetical protein
MSFVVHRVAKQAARYTDAGGREKCGYCRFFVAPRACGKVIGPVSPQGWCKYFSRQVSQQYSGSVLAGGGPPGATLALDFMSSGNLPAGVTFSRASTATYTDPTGTIQTAAVNQPRWDYANGVLRGLLIEEARTNSWLFSGDLSNAATGSGGVIVTGPVITGNQVIAPDGTMTGTRLVYPAVSSVGQSSAAQQGVTVTVAPWSFSVWLRGDVGGEQVYLSTTPDGVMYFRTLAVLTTVWQRFTLTTGNLTAAGWFFLIGTDRRDASQGAAPAQTIYAWGTQVEPGAFPTSYIPTTSASVTRAADSCTIPPANITPAWFDPKVDTWFAEFIDLTNAGVYVTNNGRVIGETNVSGGRSPIVDTVNAGIGSWDGAAFFNSGGLAPLGSVIKGATTWIAGRASVCMNGGTVGAIVTQSQGFGSFATTGIKFMQPSPTPIDNITGYIRRVQYWPRVLSDAEMQQVTT